VEQGAVWQKHWSFLPPVRREPPQVSDPHWPINAIDNFVLARLDREGLKASPEADRRTMIRSDAGPDGSAAHTGRGAILRSRQIAQRV
jgi:hypothetical protein